MIWTPSAFDLIPPFDGCLIWTLVRFDLILDPDGNCYLIPRACDLIPRMAVSILIPFGLDLIPLHGGNCYLIPAVGDLILT